MLFYFLPWKIWNYGKKYNSLRNTDQTTLKKNILYYNVLSIQYAIWQFFWDSAIGYDHCWCLAKGSGAGPLGGSVS